MAILKKDEIIAWVLRSGEIWCADCFRKINDPDEEKEAIPYTESDFQLQEITVICENPVCRRRIY